MRKVAGVVLVGIGVFGILLAILLPTVAVPRSKKTPLDLNITIVSTGAAKLLDAASGETKTVQLKATRIVRSDSQKSDSTNTVVNESLCIVVVQANTPDCVPSSDPRLLSATTDRVAADRKTGKAVNDSKYGANVNGDKSVKHVGMGYKWPIDAKKKTYQFFNTDLKKAFPAKYLGTEKLQGLTVYKYVCDTGDQDYMISGIVSGKYNDTRTVYVEPKTGAIIKGVEHQVQTISGGAVALDTTLTFDQQSQKNQADYARNKINQLKLASLYVPIIAGVLGIVLLVLGLMSMRNGRNRPAAAAAGPAVPQSPADSSERGARPNDDGPTEPNEGQASTQE